MPVYNGEAYLEAALESVSRQGDPGIEVIAVDDGSTDATLSILESYRGPLRLSIVTVPHGGNWVTNTNLALARASADHASILHQDDFWLEGRSERMRLELARHPGAALIFHAVWFVDGAGRRLGRWTCPLPGGESLSAGEMGARLITQNFISILGPVFDVKLAREIGGLDESLWYTADWELWLRLSRTGPSVYVEEPLGAFRVHRASQTFLRGRRSSEFRRQLSRVLDRQLSIQAGDLDGKVVRAARFSIDVNVFLASNFVGAARQLLPLLASAVALRPGGWRHYLANSRLGERLKPRLLMFGRSPRVRSETVGGVAAARR